MTERMTLAEFHKEKFPIRNMAVVIGIDPGLHTGVAIYSNELDDWGELRSMTFWEAHDMVAKLDPHTYGLVIEAPTKNVIYGKQMRNRQDPVEYRHRLFA